MYTKRTGINTIRIHSHTASTSRKQQYSVPVLVLYTHNDVVLYRHTIRKRVAEESSLPHAAARAIAALQ